MSVMKIKFLLTGLMILSLLNSYSQGLSCGESDPFCTGTAYDFPAGTTGAAEAGPYYGCLSSQPAPAWYHMKIGNPGPITIYMHSIPQKDIDFACWGPFTDPVTPCPNGLTVDKMVDCCYCSSWEEWCDIPNGQTGEYYILLITNYSQQACNILFSQTGGTGSTDCSILPPMVNSDSPLCTGDTLHLYAETISNATYSWSGPNGFSSTDQNPVILDVTPVNAGDYACIITVYSQTSPPAITNVVINELPDAFLLNANITVCPGSMVPMPVQLIGMDPFEIIYCDGANYYTASGLTGPVDTIFVTPPGPATYTFTQVSDMNCTKPLTGITFAVLNFPPATGILTGDATICEGDTAQLVFYLNGSPPWTITYLINGSNPQTLVTGSSPFVLPVYPLTTTHYQLTQVYDANCIGTASGQAVVTVDYPYGDLSGDNTICTGDAAQLIFTLTGFPPWTITYTVNDSNEQTVTSTYSPFSVTVTPLESTLYEFTYLEDFFCIGATSGQAMITVNQPTGELNGSSTICVGEPAQLTFILTGTPPWSITYTENGGNQQNVVAFSSPFYHEVSPLFTTTYEFIYFEDNSCPGLASGQALITVNPEPAVNAGPDKTIPNGTSTILEGNVTGGSGSYGYQWQPEDKLVNSQVLQPLTVNLTSSTLFTLVATDNDGGCYGDDAILVTITGGVLSCSAFANPTEICREETTHLQAIPSGGSGNYTYSWVSDPSGFYSDIQNPVVSPDQTTSYCVAINDGYNTVQADANVTVHQLPIPEAGSDQMIIFGTPTILNGSASSGSGNYNYHWEPAFKLINPDIALAETVNLNETTLFTLSVTDAATGCICSGTDEMQVIISGNALNVNPSAQQNTICTGDSTRIFSLPGGGTGTYSYTWTSDPPGFISSSPDNIVKPFVNTVYFVVVSDGFNSASGSVGVTVNQSPILALGPDTIVCVFDSLTIDAGNEGSEYLWNNGSTTRKITLASIGIGFDMRTVSVTVTSQEGCKTSGRRIIAFDFSACSGINDQYNSEGLLIYPNPGNGLIYLERPDECMVLQISVTDFSGKDIIKNKEIILSEPNNQLILDLTPYPAGIYLIRLTGTIFKPVSSKYILNK
jgi:hypothetical protein